MSDWPAYAINDESGRRRSGLVFASAFLALLLSPGVVRSDSKRPPCRPVGCSYVPVETPANPEPELTFFDACACLHSDSSVSLVSSHAENLEIEPDGLATVYIQGEGVIYRNSAGKIAWVLPFDNGADYFEEGLARTLVDGKVGFINRDLDVVVEPVWDFAFPFDDGLAVVCTGCKSVQVNEHSVVEGGLWGYVDAQGGIVVPVQYSRHDLPSRNEVSAL